MDKKELLDRFYSLWSEVKTNRDHKGMEVSLCMLKKAIQVLAEVNLRGMKELVECYEGNLKYCNFLTESEAEDIVEKFSNQDGTKGSKWKDPEEVFRKIASLAEGKVECEPYYNKWALYVAMNKFSSDQDSVIVKWIGDDKDKYFEVCYDLALTQLKDKDRPHWVRPYYGLSE